MAWGQDNSAQNALAILQMLQQMKQQKLQQAQLRLENLLNAAPAGTTFGQLGLGEKDLKRVLGRVPAPNEVAKVLTPDEIMRKARIDFLNHAPSDVINSLAMTTEATKAGAPSAVYTRKGFQDVGKFNESEAATSRQISESTSSERVKQAQLGAKNSTVSTQLLGDQIDAAFESWKGLDKATQTQIAQKNVLGQTAAEAQANEVSQNLKTQIQKTALKAVVNPDPSMQRFWSSLGISPASGIALLGLGGEGLLNARAQMLASLAVGNKEAENLILRSDLSVSAELAKKFGVSSSAMLGQMRMLEQGKEPTSDLGKGIQAGLRMSMDAAVADAAQKGDPEYNRLIEMMQAATKFTDNPSMLQNYMQLINRQKAIITMHQKGVSRSVTDKFQQAQYDATVDQLAKSYGLSFKKKSFWSGLFSNITGSGQVSLTPPGGTMLPIGTMPQQQTDAASVGNQLQQQVQGQQSQTPTAPQANAPVVNDLNQFLSTSGLSPSATSAVADYLKARQQAGQP
jgi:hypothetical protein